jgi:3-oxoacyl-[acyl-carrier protein] reductase
MHPTVTFKKGEKKSMMSLKDKVCIVTGGSRGIGRGISEALAAEGANLAIIFRNNAKAFEDLRSALTHCAVRIEGYQMDVTAFNSVKKTFQQIYDDFSSIDVLVNCAGRSPSTNSVARGTPKEWHAIIDVDLHAPYYCSKVALDYMREKGGGNIVNISSVVANTCHAGSASYASAKAGLEAFTKVLAREEAHNGIRVNAIAPGLIQSDMSDKMTKVYGQERIKEVYESIPLRRFGEPRDIGNLVVYLVSEKGDYITGQVLGVDGGMYYWKSTFSDL